VKEEMGVALSLRHFRRVESIEFNSSSQCVNPLLAEHMSQTDHSVFLESSDVLVCDGVYGQTVHGLQGEKKIVFGATLKRI